MQVENYRSQFDHEKTFNARKFIYKSLEQAQKLEHETIKGISAKSIETKRAILLLISEWLTALKSENKSRIAEMSNVTGMDLTTWTKLQIEAVALQSDLAQKLKARIEAEKAYDAAAPLGFVSSWFADGKEEANIKTKKSDFQSCKAQAEHASQKLENNISARQAFGETFINKALQNMSALVKCADVGPSIQKQLDDLALHMKNSWVLLKGNQTKHLDAIKLQVAELDRNYA